MSVSTVTHVAVSGSAGTFRARILGRVSATIAHSNLGGADLPVVYLTLMGVALVPFLLLQAPFQTSDAFSQFARAVELIRGQLDPAVQSSAGVGVMLPTSVAKLFYLFWPLYLHHGVARVTRGQLTAASHLYWGAGTTFVPSNGSPLWPDGSAVYSGIFYLPQVLALEVARVMHLSLLTAYYLACAFNGVAAVAVSCVALRVARVGRTLMFGILLLPMTLSLYFSVSQDATLIALGALLFALFSRAILSPPSTVARYRVTITWLSMLGFLLCVNRPTNAPVFLILLLIPPPKARVSPLAAADHEPRWAIWHIRTLPGRWWAIVTGGGFALASAASFLLSLIFDSAGATQPGASILRQMEFQLHHPLSAVAVLLASVLHNAQNWAVTFMGQLGWYGAGPTLGPAAYIAIGACLVVLMQVGAPLDGNSMAAPRGDGSPPPSMSTRLAWQGTALALVALCWLATMEVMYLSWSPVGASVVSGAQGRYLLPVAFFLGLATVRSPGSRWTANVSALVYIGVTVSALLVSSVVLLNFFWIPR